MKSYLEKKTKIVATIGPATESEKQLEKLFKAGVNVVRLNFSHNTHDWHQKIYDRTRKITEKQKRNIGVLQDLSGPKIRIGDLKEEKIILKKGKKIILTTDTILGDEKRVSVNYKKLPLDVKKGAIIKIEDGKKSIRVDKTTKTEIYCTVLVGGFLSARKGINVPGVDLSVYSLTSKDKKDVLFGIKNKVDFIALSFVQNKNDILHLKKILEKNHCEAMVIAKIETSAAIKNIEDIINVSDGVMVARGDLAIEIGAEKVPMLQKEIITRCNELGKPVITSTQMLDSMEESPVPTRAEVSDIANAILDGTDAIMLSGETTIGKYPIEAVKTMTSIAQRTEPYHEDVDLEYFFGETSLADSLTQSVVQIANNINAKLIVSLTESGFTARMISRFKPHQLLVSITPHKETAQKLSLSYGNFPLILTLEKRTSKNMENILDLIKKEKLAKKGEKVVVTMGYPFGKVKSTNKILVLDAK